MFKVFIEKLSNWISLYPKKSLAIVFIIVIATLPGLLNIQMDYGVRVWFRKSDKLLKNFNYFRSTFGNDDVFLVSIDHPNGIFNPKTLELMRDLTNQFWNVPDIIRVDSLNNYTYISTEDNDILIEEFIPDKMLTQKEADHYKKLAMEHKQMPGQVISYDGNSALFLLRVKPLFDQLPDFMPMAKRIDEIIAPYKKDGYRFHQIGTAKVTETFRDVAESDLFLLIPLLCFLIFLLLLYVFKSLAGVVIPFSIISFTIMSAMGISGYMGVKLNNLSGMVPTILIAICIADAIHILKTYLRFDGHKDRASETIKKNFMPTFLTTVSTSIGFLSLGLNELIPIRDFGILCGIACILSWLYSILGIVPAMKIFFKNEKISIVSKENPTYVSYFVRQVEFHKYKWIMGFILFTFSGIFFGMKNEVNSNPFNYFDKDNYLARSNRFFLDNYKGINGLDLVVNSGGPGQIHDPKFLESLDRFQTWLNELPYVNKTNSILDDLKELNKAFHDGDDTYFKAPQSHEDSAQLYLFYSLGLPSGMDLGHRVDIKEQSLRLRVLWNIQNSKESVVETLKIEQKAKEFGLDLFATGQEYLFQRMNGYVVRGYFTSIAISIVIITIMMMFVLGSVKMGLVSIFPNIIPIVSGAFGMYLWGRPIDVGTVLVSSVCFGIAIDDTIHFLTEMNHYLKKGSSFKNALEKSLAHTGNALISTTFILMAGFGVFAFAEFIPNFNFGVFSALVLFVALLTDFIFLPALLKISAKD